MFLLFVAFTAVYLLICSIILFFLKNLKLIRILFLTGSILSLISIYKCFEIISSLEIIDALLQGFTSLKK